MQDNVKLLRKESNFNVAMKIMKKSQLLTVLGVMVAMGLTGCKTGGKSSDAPAASSNQPVSSAPAPKSSTPAQSSSQAPAPVVVPDPDGHHFGADADVAADTTAGTVAYKKATCSDNDGFVRLKVNQSVVSYASGSKRKESTPEGYTKLDGNNQSMSFKFKADKKYMGKLFLYGCMDGWGADSNHSAGFYYQNNPNVEIKLNGNVIDVSGSKSGSYAQWFGEDASEEDSSLSKEGYAPYGNVVINEGVNEIVYTRKQTLNMLIKDFVFIVEEFNEWGTAQAVAADATKGTVAYNLYTNQLNGSKKIEVQLADSMLTEGSVNKNDPAGYIKLKNANDSWSFKIDYASIAYGDIYQRGVMDSWLANKGKNLFSSGTAGGADDFKIEVNEAKVNIYPSQKAKTFEQAMPGDAQEGDLSPLSDVLTAPVTLKAGVNEVKYTRLASMNLALTHLVMIVKNSDHAHTVAEGAEWQKDADYHWHVCNHEGCGEIFDKFDHTWVDDESQASTTSTCQVPGVKYQKCSVCGQTRTVNLPLGDHSWKEGTAIQNSDGKDVTPISCETENCTHCGAKMAYNAFSACTDTAITAASSSIQMADNNSITYKIVVANAGTYRFDMYGKYQSGNSQSKLVENGHYSLKVNDADAVLNTLGYSAMGLSSSGSKQFTIAPEITLKAGENTIVLTQGDATTAAIAFKGNIWVYEK